jgi:hypothetical protein
MTNEDAKLQNPPLEGAPQKKAPDFSGASFVFVIAYAT